MPRYIDAEPLEDKFYEAAEAFTNDLWYWDQICNSPTAKVEPIIEAEWILEREPDGRPYCLHCSHCDDDFHNIGIKVAYKRCPECGAHMKYGG